MGLGTFGQVATQTLLDQKRKQYPSQYTATDFKNQFGLRVHDCVGLIKGFLWTNDGKLTYNPAQDKDVSGMLANCNEIGSIDKIPEVKGLLVFMKGHVGVYIGNGYVIEAKGHKYGVVKTKLKDRPWTQYGKLKWITYEEEQPMLTLDEALEYLSRKGLLLEPEYWKNGCNYVKKLDHVFIKWANSVAVFDATDID